MSVSNNISKTNDNQVHLGNSNKHKTDKTPLPPRGAIPAPTEPGDSEESLTLFERLLLWATNIDETNELLPGEYEECKLVKVLNAMISIPSEISSTADAIERLAEEVRRSNDLMERRFGDGYNPPVEPGTSSSRLPTNRPSPPSKSRIVQVSPTMKHVRDLTKAG